MWTIRPFAGLGPLSFGMTPRDVERILGVAAVDFRKGVSEQRTLAFNALGVHAYFDQNDELNFIEVFFPCTVSLGGHTLFGSRSEVLDALHEVGVDARDDGSGGLWADSSGFALFAPGDKVEGVSVYIKGYPGSQ